jgi:hypothetical protein
MPDARYNTILAGRAGRLSLHPEGLGQAGRSGKGLSDQLSDNHAVLGGRGRTPVDCGQLVRAVSAKAMHVSLCLRDEEADASSADVAGGSLTELP